jgi:hypothetical protein
MKITIKDKTITIPVTSKLYSDIKAVLVRSSDQQNPNYHIHTGDILDGETYRKYMRDYDMSGSKGKPSQNKSGISSQDIHDQLHSHHMASAAMNKTMARMYTSNKKAHEDLAKAHENMAKALQKNHEFQKTVY